MLNKRIVNIIACFFVVFQLSAFNCLGEIYVQHLNQPTPVYKKGIFCSINSENDLILYKKPYKPGDELGKLWIYDIKKQKEYLVCDTIDMLNPDPAFYDSTTIIIPTTDIIIAYNTKSKLRRIIFKTKHNDQFLNGFHFDPITRNIITTLLDFKTSEAFLLVVSEKGEILHKVKVSYNFDNSEELSHSRIYAFKGGVVFNMLFNLFYFDPASKKTTLISKVSYSFGKPVFFVSDSSVSFCKWRTLEMSFLKNPGDQLSKMKIPSIFSKNGQFDFDTYSFQVNSRNVNYIKNKQKAMSIQDSKMEYVNAIVQIVKTDTYSVSQDLSKNTIVINYN
jgi:hypothetical protein